MAETTFSRYLKDFKSDKAAFKAGNWGHEQGLKLNPGEIPLPSLVFVCLVVLSRFGYWGKSEKTLWEIPIKYRSLPFLLSHRKFGLGLSGRQGVVYPPSIENELIKNLNGAIKASEAELQSYANRQVRTGNCSVPNNYIKLNMMYLFFRDKAKSAFSRSTLKPIASITNTKGNVISSRLNRLLKAEQQGFYYTIAMVDAFFSRLEHLLILVLPFIGFDATIQSLSAIMSANWTDKYKRVFDLTTDRKAKSLFDELIFIKERYRNAIMHGYFEKQGASLFFHLPPYAIPASLTRFKDSIHYSFLPIKERSFKDVCSLFDRMDAFFKSGKTKYGLRFAESGLDVSFDSKSLSEYVSASTSNIAFEKFVDLMSYLDSNSVNMDW